MSRTIAQVLADARARLDRLDPAAARAAQESGAVLVDIRPQAQRERDGEVPDALVIERNHLEWRFDPTSEARVAEAVDHDVRVVVLCDEGYTSALAAAALQELGLHAATDVDGGFRSWRACGLPVVPGCTPAGSRVPVERG